MQEGKVITESKEKESACLPKIDLMLTEAGRWKCLCNFMKELKCNVKARLNEEEKIIDVVITFQDIHLLLNTDYYWTCFNNKGYQIRFMQEETKATIKNILT